jgi:hypothetical protein
MCPRPSPSRKRGASSTGHEDRETSDILRWVREGIADTLLGTVLEQAPEIPPDDLDAVRDAAYQATDAVDYVTLPQDRLCFRCGAPLEQATVTGDDLVKLYQAADGSGSADVTEDPSTKSPAVRRWDLIDQADPRRLRWERVHHRMELAETGGPV